MSPASAATLQEQSSWQTPAAQADVQAVGDADQQGAGTGTGCSRCLPSMSAGSLHSGEERARWGRLAPPAIWLFSGCSFCKQHGEQDACWSALWGDAPHAQAETGDSHKLMGFLIHCFIAECKHLRVVSQTARPQRCSAGLAMETRSPRSNHHAANRDHP